MYKNAHFLFEKFGKNRPQKKFFLIFWYTFGTFEKKESLTNGLVKRFVRQFATIPILCSTEFRQTKMA